MKKSLIYLAAAVILIPAFNSCKKGEEDPFSFSSRDSRITGTWTLKSFDETKTTTKTTVITNDVNSDKVTNVTTTTEEVKIASGNSTYSKTIDVNNKSEYKTYTSSWENETSTFTSKDVESVSNSLDVTVSVYNDNTYIATYTEGAKKTETSSEASINGGSTSSTSDSETELDGSTRTWTEEGTWSWADAKKDKVIINAGPLQGYLLKLGTDEAITLEESDEKDVDVDVEEDNFDTYSNSSPTDDKVGKETTEVTTTVVYTSKATWEKTDKESDKE